MILCSVQQTHRSRRKRSRAQGDQLRDSRTKKIEDIDGARRSPVRELPEELEEFDDNLVDEEASASREAPRKHLS